MSMMAERPSVCPFDNINPQYNPPTSGINDPYNPPVPTSGISNPYSSTTSPKPNQFTILSPPEEFSNRESFAKFQETQCPLNDPRFSQDLESNANQRKFSQDSVERCNQAVQCGGPPDGASSVDSSGSASPRVYDDPPLRPSNDTVPNHNSSISEFPDEDTVTLLPCLVCNRTFTPIALARHRKICEKLQTKRKTSVSSIKSPDLSSSPIHTKHNKDADKTKKSRWREKHQEFLRSIRAAKKTTNDSDSTMGQGPMIPSDYIKCPHCERHFGPKAADRHIEWCREQSSRMGHRPSIVDSAAVERLKNRTKYIPPKPGQNGWRAPKKKDVISSIPPPSAGPLPGSRLGSPPAPSLPRHLSPPPMSPSRRGSTASTGSMGSPHLLRAGSMSLGRSAGKQFSAYLQSSRNPGYGSSSGYGETGMGRRDSNTSQFSRAGSLRMPHSPKMPSRRSSGRMARRRDLASDMLASVCLEDKSKRGEPEGVEDKKDNSRLGYGKLEEVPYDPFSAAELQFQALLDPSGGSLGASGLGSGMLGSTGSLKYVGLGDHNMMKGRNKNRNNNLSTLSLTSIGLDSSDFLRKEYDYPEMKRGYHRSPEGRDGLSKSDKNKAAESRLWSWTQTPSSNTRNSVFRSPITIDPPDEPIMGIESPSLTRKFSYGLSSNPQSPYSSRKTSWETNSFRSTSPLRKQSWESSPPRSPTPSSRKTSWGSPNRSPSPPGRKSSQGSPPPRSSSPLHKLWNDSQWCHKETLNSPKTERKPTTSTESYSPFSPRRLFSSSLATPSSSGAWSDSSNSKSFSRHFSGGSTRTVPGESYSTSGRGQGTSRTLTGESFSTSVRGQGAGSAFENLKSLKKSLDSGKRDFESPEDAQLRISSGSSTDSSLPPLSSSASSASPSDRKVSGEDDATSAMRMPRFCHDCGHKYPTLMAKFCCQCGSMRPNLD